MDSYFKILFNKIISTLFAPTNEDKLEEKAIANVIIEKCELNEGIEKRISNNFAFYLTQHKAFKESLNLIKGDSRGLKVNFIFIE